MRWGKILLIFQAVVTLIIGIAFFSQLTIIKDSEINELREDLIKSQNISETSSEPIMKIKQRFTIAAYTLLVVGLLELIIITRLLS